MQTKMQILVLMQFPVGKEYAARSIVEGRRLLADSIPFLSRPSRFHFLRMMRGA
jgi:hypothetical protein